MCQAAPSDFEAELARHASRLARDGVGALEPLYDHVESRLFRYAYYLTRTLVEAEDVVQASFLKLMKSPQRLSQVARPWPYLLRMVRNEACTLRRGKQPHVQWEAIEELSADQEICNDTWERALSVQAALKELPVVQAEVITLKIWEGLTFREIAEVTGDSLHAVSSRYRYGLDRLARLLQAHAPDQAMELAGRRLTPGTERDTPE